MPPADDDATLVLAVRGGDQGAFTPLFERWSDRCFDVARRIIHDDGRAAEVTQETFLVAWQQIDTLRDPAAFGGWVLRTARNKALNRLEHERWARPTDPGLATFVDRPSADGPDDLVEAAMTATDHHEFLDAATAVLGEREASVLDLHLRHGLSAAEIGEELGVTTNNAHQLLHRTKKRLTAGIRAWVLVRGGRPSCDELAGELEAAGVTFFGREAADVIGSHAEGCDDCGRRQAAVLDPGSLFAAAPLVVLAPEVRSTIADGLRAAGVPIDATMPDGQPAATEAGPPSRRRTAALLVSAAIIVAVAVAGVALVDVDEADRAAPSATTTVGTSSTTEAGPRSTSTSSSTTTTTTTSVAGAAAPTTQPPNADQGDPPGGSVAPNPATTTRPATTATRPATTTTTQPAALRIDSFGARPAAAPGGACGAGQWATTLRWTTTNATSASLSAATVTPITGLAPDGSRVVCRPTPGKPRGGWTLTATGPGGEASRVA